MGINPNPNTTKFFIYSVYLFCCEFEIGWNLQTGVIGMNWFIKGVALAGFVAAIAVMAMVAANLEREPIISHVTMANLDLDDQLTKVDHMVVVLVKEVIKPDHDKDAYPDNPRYFGDVIVIVEEDLLGTVHKDEILVRTYPYTDHTTHFAEGERALLFLVPVHPESVEGEDVYRISGRYQGKYSFDEANDRLVDPKYAEKTYKLSEIKARLADLSR